MTVTAEEIYARAVEKHGADSVGVEQLGDAYQEILQKAGKRRENESYYTPGPVASFMTRFALTQAIEHLGPAPVQVLRIVVIDPACGAGVFLVEAARRLAHAYASRLAGAEPAGDLMHAVLPNIILNCVYGIDIDAVAVDLARLALSLETARTVTPEMLARHVIVGNTLAGASPPALDDRIGPQPEMAP